MKVNDENLSIVKEFEGIAIKLKKHYKNIDFDKVHDFTLRFNFSDDVLHMRGVYLTCQEL